MRHSPIVPGTAYRVRSKYNKGREETFVIVDSKEQTGRRRDESAMCLSRETPFAQFLAGLSEGDKAVFLEPDGGSRVQYEVLSIEVPPVDRSYYVSQLRESFLSTARFRTISGFQGATIPVHVWSDKHFWQELSRKDWDKALVLALESGFDGPCPDLQPQADLLRLFVRHDVFPSSLVDCWSYLPVGVRFLTMALIVKYDVPWTVAKTVRDKERTPHFRSLIDLIVNARGRPVTARKKAFLQFNRALQDLVVRRAWNSTDEIDLTPLLPECTHGRYVHCEAQDWEKGRDKGLVWCRGHSCGEAHITAERILPLNRWRLPEFLEALKIEPPSEVVSKPREYVTKLGGWINRLNDIRERLRCTHCGEFMRPHGSYSKNLARYHVTVLQCENPVCDACGEGVYLSHCWACHRPIDSSRETPVQVEGRYLCARCGSGPRESDDYSQGDVCPACDSENMRRLNGGRRFVCQDCSHAIEAPPDWAITGPRRQDRQRCRGPCGRKRSLFMLTLDSATPSSLSAGMPAMPLVTRRSSQS